MNGIRNHKITEKLLELIARRGVSQAEIARKLSIAPSVLSRQLQGKESLPLSRVEDLIQILAPSVEECKQLRAMLQKKEPQSFSPQRVPAVKVYWNEDIAYFARQIIDAKIGTGCACWISERAYAQRTPEQEKIPITLSRAMLYVLMIIQDYELEVEGR